MEASELSEMGCVFTNVSGQHMYFWVLCGFVADGHKKCEKMWFLSISPLIFGLKPHFFTKMFLIQPVDCNGYKLWHMEQKYIAKFLFICEDMWLTETQHIDSHLCIFY